MKNVKDKDRILNTATKKQLITYKGAPLRLSSDISIETLHARRYWPETVKVMKSKDIQPRLLYPANLLFRIEGHRKSFLDKKKLKEFITTKPVLHEILKSLKKKK